MYVKIGSQRLEFDDTGGNRPAIIFSHGFGMTRAMFAPQLAAFGPTHRCITWDSRAHGGSPTDGPFDYWDSARDALAVLDHVGVERAVFVGTSQGGFLSLRAALLAPERVRAIAVIGSSATAESAEKRAVYTQMRDVFVAGGPAGPPEELLKTFAHLCLGSDRIAETWKPVWRAWPSEQFALAFRTLVDRDDIAGRLSQISAPTLVLHGADDAALAPTLGQAIAAGVRNPEGFVLVEHGTHYLNLTHPEPVNAALKLMLEKYADD
jgi:pimeloyl-ACP methyl ester carboxylesterase